MGVYIKGMEMPKNCGTCPLRRGDCSQRIYMEKRPDSCPIVPVPPHGRLIDADALIKEMDKQENAMYEHGREFSFSFESGGDVCTAWYNVEIMVEDAPTIIPAEGGE